MSQLGDRRTVHRWQVDGETIRVRLDAIRLRMRTLVSLVVAVVVISSSLVLPLVVVYDHLIGPMPPAYGLRWLVSMLPALVVLGAAGFGTWVLVRRALDSRRRTWTIAFARRGVVIDAADAARHEYRWDEIACIVIRTDSDYARVGLRLRSGDTVVLNAGVLVGRSGAGRQPVIADLPDALHDLLTALGFETTPPPHNAPGRWRFRRGPRVGSHPG